MTKAKDICPNGQ